MVHQEVEVGNLVVDAGDTLMQDDSKVVGFCNGGVSCIQASSCAQADSGFQLTLNSKSEVHVGEDGAEPEVGGGVDAPSQ